MATVDSAKKAGRPGISMETWNRVVDLLEERVKTPQEISKAAEISLSKVYEIKRNPIKKTAPTADTAEA